MSFEFFNSQVQSHNLCSRDRRQDSVYVTWYGDLLEPPGAGPRPAASNVAIGRSERSHPWLRVGLSIWHPLSRDVKRMCFLLTKVAHRHYFTFAALPEVHDIRFEHSAPRYSLPPNFSSPLQDTRFQTGPRNSASWRPVNVVSVATTSTSLSTHATSGPGAMAYPAA